MGICFCVKSQQAKLIKKNELIQTNPEQALAKYKDVREQISIYIEMLKNHENDGNYKAIQAARTQDKNKTKLYKKKAKLFNFQKRYATDELNKIDINILQCETPENQEDIFSLLEKAITIYDKLIEVVNQEKWDKNMENLELTQQNVDELQTLFKNHHELDDVRFESELETETAKLIQSESESFTSIYEDVKKIDNTPMSKLEIEKKK